jgi:hypothetical protein
METTAIVLHPDNTNRKQVFSLDWALKPLIQIVKELNAGSTDKLLILLDATFLCNFPS